MRKVFFSFHYSDNWRVQQVQNCQVVTTKINVVDRFQNPQKWEEVQRKGDAAIKEWINSQMSGTSVTVVLIGTDTSSRKWVKYEIQKSIDDGKGLLGIRIHKIRDSSGKTASKGASPFVGLKDSEGKSVSPSIYDWDDDKGREKISEWIEDAAKAAGR